MIWQKQPSSTTSQTAIEEPKEALAPRYDVIVVGGGVNGLTCAAFAARAGKSVLLLEATESLGGGCQSLELSSGETISRAAHLLRHFDGTSVGKLGLRRKGFALATTKLPTIALGEEGKHIRFDRSLLKTGGSLVSLNERDAERYVALNRRIMKLARAIGRDAGRAEGKTKPANEASLWPQPPAGLTATSQRLYREMSISSIGHFLEREFETPLLRGAIAFDAILGRNFSPYWPGTALNWPIALSGSLGRTQGGLAMPVGGMGGLTLALVRALLRHGGTFRTNRPVTRLIADAGTIKGVEIAGKSQIEAGQVVCAFGGADSLMEDLLVARHQTSGLYQPTETPKGSVAKLNLELDGLPEGPGGNPLEPARYVVAPSLEKIEQAFAPTKYRQFPAEPVMEVLFPSLTGTKADKTKERHAASVIVQFAPFDVAGGWEEARDKFIGRCAATLDHYLPGLAKRIVGGELLSPPDLEAKLGITGGHWHFYRPMLQSQAEFDRDHQRGIRSRDVSGLYFCGGDRHPGAGVRAASGRFAAEALLKDARASRRR